MFSSIAIKNYILIKEITISFDNGFNVITGETGAGKSILLGALSLLSGKRADLNTLKDKTKKCIIEGIVHIPQKTLQDFFTSHDIDFDKETIIRREIMPSGKSRAFINDTPVNLKVLEYFFHQVTDIHSQHQNTQLKQNQFKLSIIDAIAQNQDLLKHYQKKYHQYKVLDKDYRSLLLQIQEAQKEKDYWQYQFDRLEEAQLQEQEQDEIENTLQQLQHAEEIKQNISTSFYLLSEEDNSVINHLQNIKQQLSSIENVYPSIKDYLQRISSNLIDLQDMAPDLESLISEIDYNPQKIEQLTERLNLIYDLQRKHQVSNTTDLLEVQDGLSQKLSHIVEADFDIKSKKQSLEKIESELQELAQKISENRQKIVKTTEKKILFILSDLGMEKAQLSIIITVSDSLQENGRNDIEFMFSANEGTALEPIEKAISGGELSRLMLAFKYITSQSSNLTSLILDEIDVGISGEIAKKMGTLMQEMSKNRQLIVITHLPQIAAKGQKHFKVIKINKEGYTESSVIPLDKDQKLEEIASMISGSSITPTALKNAKELIDY